MSLSPKAQEVVSQLETESPKMGDIKKLAKSIKKDTELAWELWGTGEYVPRLLAALIFEGWAARLIWLCGSLCARWWHQFFRTTQTRHSRKHRRCTRSAMRLQTS